jgi:hypothetical protein
MLPMSGAKIPQNNQATPLYFRNDSGEEAPAYACMQVTGTVEDTGQNYFKIDKPVDSNGAAGPFLWNLHTAVPDGEFGIATAGPSVRTLSDNATPSAGDKLSPQSGSWYVAAGGSIVNAAGPDDIADNVIRGMVGGGGGGATIMFQIIGPSGAAEAASNHCDDKLEDAQSEYEATVLYRPCGSTAVEGEVDGVVTVVDASGSFLAGREEAEVEGKIGFATYMLEDGAYECEWVITFIDWWREVQMISDVIQTADEIRFEVKRVEVWDDCDLDPIIIPLTDCTDTS